MTNRPIAARIVLGCCGWSYLRPNDFAPMLRMPFASTLQAYAQLFPAVEVNTTFYRVPRIATAEKWKTEATAVRGDFSFTVKAFRGITHVRRFEGSARQFFDATREVADTLDAPVILFQSPASFAPSRVNVDKMRSFVESIERRGRLLAWEPRGKWLDEPGAIVEVCESGDLIHCVDPFRTPPLTFGTFKVAYFRMHGFGVPSMYRYVFSTPELKDLLAIVRSLPSEIRQVYIFFNNAACYHNALEFHQLVN